MLGLLAASILVWLGFGEWLPEEWDPSGIPAVSPRLSPVLAFVGVRIKDVGFSTWL